MNPGPWRRAGPPGDSAPGNDDPAQTRENGRNDMSEMDKSWAQELQRRIDVYDGLEAKGDWRGRMSGVDYIGILALAVGLVAGFWAWGV